jgi:rod shape-determining protein MreC
MKPLNLFALLLFLWGVIWVLTLSERSVRKIQQTYYRTTAPFLKGGSALKLKAERFLDEVENSKDTENRLKSMEVEFVKLRSIEGRLRELERENNVFRAALDFKKRSSLNVIAARVIKRQPSTWWETAILDRGEESGIGLQIPIIAPGGLAGKIDTVSSDTSTMILLTDERCQVSVQVAGTPEVGILHGLRGHYGEEPRLLLRHLSREASIRPGMKVVTTGKGGVFPENILVGTVKAYTPGTLEGSASVEPSVDFANLKVVFVIANKEEG